MHSYKKIREIKHTNDIKNKHLDGIFLIGQCKLIRTHIDVVTKKPPMCQIMHFSLNCMYGLIEG